jgi:hypothetical protein
MQLCQSRSCAILSIVSAEGNASRERTRAGLCADCRYMRLVESNRGSRFYFCGRSVSDPAFPKYPRLPVIQCLGYESKLVNNATDC